MGCIRMDAFVERPSAGGRESIEALLARLTERLVETGQCDARAVERARRVGAESGQRLDAVLTQLGLVSDRGLAEATASLLGLPLATAEDFPAEPVLPELLAPRFLRDARVLPCAAADGRIALAVADPLDRFAPSAIAARTGMEVVLRVAVPLDLEAAIARLYPEADAPADRAEAGDGAPLEEDAERLRDLASEAPVIRLVNQLIARAVETQASDIHLEPFEDRLRLRYRYDGVLHEAEAPPARLAAAIVSRVKIMARLDIAERRLPQDGRIKLAVRGHEIDFRVSTIPSLHGETVVLRVLDRSAVAFDYGRLGLAPAIAARFGAALELPNGIVLHAGRVKDGGAQKVLATTRAGALLDLFEVTGEVKWLSLAERAAKVAYAIDPNGEEVSAVYRRFRALRDRAGRER